MQSYEGQASRQGCGIVAAFAYKIPPTSGPGESAVCHVGGLFYLHISGVTTTRPTSPYCAWYVIAVA